MNDTNDIQYSNEGQVEQLNHIRYTNDDVPYNEVEGYTESATYKEFGTDSIKDEKAGESVGLRRGHFSGDYDIVKIASTFAIVSIVAMAVVLDDSPFGSFFNPIMGPISEAFGIPHTDDGYPGDVEISLLVTDTEIAYNVFFTIDPGSDVSLKVTNNFTNRVLAMPDEDSRSGTVTGLAKGMSYQVSVVIAGDTVRTKTVSTLETYDEVPSCELVYARCYCMEDQTFHFMINVIDRNGIWSEFRAELTDEGGIKNVMDFAGGVNDLQKISTKDLSIPGTATLAVYCTEKTSDGTAVKTLFTQTVNI